MQLLLFLSALLAGLTGVITGDGVRVVPQQNGAAITRAAESVAETAVAVAMVAAAIPVSGNDARPAPSFAIHDAPAGRPARLTSERRLE
ncbi:hypothetical protein [Sphingomonas sp. LT1P40]|uniref:hypothetical protein n=1 Tax=Alteristakelama amylovorans TaxID=3096166 RepID=UPI002FC8A215